jgi:hypothetical protein
MRTGEWPDCRSPSQLHKEHETSGNKKRGKTMSQLVPYGDDYKQVGRQAGKALQSLNERAILSRTQIETDEQNSAIRASRRIANGYGLARQTVQLATHLNREVNEASRDNPGLAMLVKPIEEDAAACARYVIGTYMSRA